MGDFHAHSIACPDKDSPDPAVLELNDHTRKTSTSLMGLPQEMLDSIYHELWGSTGFFRFSCEIEGWPGKAEFVVEYEGQLAWGGFHDQKAELLPTWLLACKKMLYGGMKQLISKSECCTRFLEDSPLSSPNRTSFLFGSIITKAVHWMVIETPTSFWSTDSHIRKPTPLCHQQLSIAAPILSRDFKDLTTISFAFAFRVYDMDSESTKKWRRLDFFVLKGVNLPNLHTIQVQLAYKVGNCIDFPDVSTSVPRIVAQDIALLGMKLIGPRGTAISVRVYNFSFGSRTRDEGLIFMWTKDINIIAKLGGQCDTLVDIRPIDGRKVFERL